MLVKKENISKWELQFWTPKAAPTVGAGTEKQRYTVRLTNANVVTSSSA